MCVDKQADVVLERKVFDIWIRIPCINNVGSCTYPDLCDNLSTVTCPLSFVQQKVPCQCPFRKVGQAVSASLS